MNDIFGDLCLLYSYVHTQFFGLEVEVYCDAMDEIARMAHSVGYSMNDLAKVVAC